MYCLNLTRFRFLSSIRIVKLGGILAFPFGLIAGVQAPSSAFRSVRKNKKIITQENALKGKTKGARYGKSKEAEWVEYDPFEWEGK